MIFTETNRQRKQYINPPALELIKFGLANKKRKYSRSQFKNRMKRSKLGGTRFSAFAEVDSKIESLDQVFPRKKLKKYKFFV